MKIEKFIPRFSILTLLLIISLIAVGISRYLASRQIASLTEQLTTARRELAYLDAPDKKKIYAVALPSFEPRQWRWRIQLPETGRYRIASCFGKIPEDGQAEPTAQHDYIFTTPQGAYFNGGEEFILTIGVHQDLAKKWVLSLQAPGRGESRKIDAAAWLNELSSVNWTSRVAGTSGTASVDADKPLTLVRYRRAKILPGGGSTVDMQPTEGMQFWIEQAP